MVTEVLVAAAAEGQVQLSQGDHWICMVGGRCSDYLMTTFHASLGIHCRVFPAIHLPRHRSSHLHLHQETTRGVTYESVNIAPSHYDFKGSICCASSQCLAKSPCYQDAITRKQSPTRGSVRILLFPSKNSHCLNS